MGIEGERGKTSKKGKYHSLFILCTGTIGPVRIKNSKPSPLTNHVLWTFSTLHAWMPLLLNFAFCRCASS